MSRHGDSHRQSEIGPIVTTLLVVIGVILGAWFELGGFWSAPTTAAPAHTASSAPAAAPEL